MVQRKADKSEEKKEKKVRCNYCKELGHMIKDCPKVATKEARKKEAGMAVSQIPPNLMLNLLMLCRS